MNSFLRIAKNVQSRLIYFHLFDALLHILYISEPYFMIFLFNKD